MNLFCRPTFWCPPSSACGALPVALPSPPKPARSCTHSTSFPHDAWTHNTRQRCAAAEFPHSETSSGESLQSKDFRRSLLRALSCFAASKYVGPRLLASPPRWWNTAGDMGETACARVKRTGAFARVGCVRGGGHHEITRLLPDLTEAPRVGLSQLSLTHFLLGARRPSSALLGADERSERTISTHAHAWGSFFPLCLRPTGTWGTKLEITRQVAAPAVIAARASTLGPRNGVIGGAGEGRAEQKSKADAPCVFPSLKR